MVDTINTTDTSLLFSKSFTDWFKREFPGQKWLKDEYVRFDEAAGTYVLNVDFAAAYRAYFPDLAYSGVLEQDAPSFTDTAMLIELIYGSLIKPEGQSAFAQLVNLRLKEFNAPLIFADGRFEAIKAEPERPASHTFNRVTMAHKMAAAVFIIIIMLSVLRGC